MQVRAQVRGLRRSPTKVRPILGAIKGKPAAAAIEILRLLPSPVAAEVAKAGEVCHGQRGEQLRYAAVPLAGSGGVRRSWANLETLQGARSWPY